MIARSTAHDLKAAMNGDRFFIVQVPSALPFSLWRLYYGVVFVDAVFCCSEPLSLAEDR